MINSTIAAFLIGAVIGLVWALVKNYYFDDGEE